MYRKWTESAVGRLMKKAELVFRVALAPVLCPLDTGGSTGQAHHISVCSVIPNYWLRAAEGLCGIGLPNCTLDLNKSLWDGEKPVLPMKGMLGPSWGWPLPSGLRAQALQLAYRWALGKIMSCSVLIPAPVKRALALPPLQVVAGIQWEIFTPTWVPGLGVMTSSARSRVWNLEPIIGGKALGHSSLSLGFFIHKMKKINSCWFCHK